MVATLNSLFHFAVRQAQGFVQSIFQLMQLELHISSVGFPIQKLRLEQNSPKTLVFDTLGAQN